jgi:ABC-2 type transport system permease protein
LLTMPITPWQAIVGKFLASWLFLAIALALTFPIALTVNYLGSPDNGVILGSYVGSLLLAGSYLAVSCMTSAMTRNQVISFIVSVVICFLLILVGYPPVTNFLYQTLGLQQWLVETVAAFSVMTHFDGLQKGILDSRDVIFFLSIMVFSLFTTGVIIRGHRAG